MRHVLALVFAVGPFLLACSSSSSPVADGGAADIRAVVPDAPVESDGRTPDGGTPDAAMPPIDAATCVACTGLTYCDTTTGQCKPGCDSSSQCPQPGSCETATHTCSCSSGYHLCGTSCVLENATSCGAACVACANARPNASPVCRSGSCSDACGAGFNDCGGACVVDSTQSCGSSCRVCPEPLNSAASCGAGACDFACGGDFHKCSNECRANISVSSCGTSCTPCPAPGPNRKATCGGGSCGTACITSCGTGCVNIAADPANCGACGRVCATGEACSLGGCVLPCAGDRGFAGALPALGSGPGGGAVADMNGDGKLDLVVAAEIPSRVLVHPGKGNGMFLSPIALAVAGLPYFVVTGDFNKDGKVDVAVTNRNSGGVDNLLVAMGNGDGTLAAPVAYGLGSAALTLATADFNGDSNLDLAVTTVGSSAQVLLGRADGTFQTPQAIALAAGQLGILAHDLNVDGKVDLVVSTTSGTAGRIHALLGRGDGTFGAAQSFAAGMHAGLLATADFDGDAKPDLLSADHVQGGYVRLRGNGDGTFQAPVFYATAMVPSSELGGVATADLNRDGKADALMTASGTLYVRHGDGAGGLLGLGQQANGFRGALVVAQLDGNANPDVIAISDAIRVGLGDGSGIEAPKAFGNAGTGLFADFNNDGRLDLVSYGSFHAGNGDGTFGPGVSIGLASELAAADLDGDGKLDLLSAGSTFADVGVRRGNGDGTFQVLQDASIGLSPSSIAVADLNGDGKKDIALTRTGTNGLAAIALGRGDGTFGQAVTVFASTGASVVVSADFNHDGHADLAISQNDFTGRVAFLLNNGDATFQTSFTTDIQYPRRLSVGDLDGDGHADVLITSSSQISRFHVAYGDGAGAFTLALFDGYPNRGPNAIGDFNGDGRMDFAITSDGTGAPTHVFWGTGGRTFAYTPYALGTGVNTNPAMVTGDLNGDRRADLRIGGFVLMGGCR